jgi:hypothetical protein
MLLEGLELAESTRPERKVSPDPSSKKRQQVRLDGTKRRGS